jgi:putative two-component system response regulator
MVTERESILIIDNEELARRLLRKKLSRGGYHCEEAGNAEEALDKLRMSPRELVILDKEMAGRSGGGLLPEIRANHPDTAVIMAIATAGIDIIIGYMKDGAEDYISKPFDLDEAMLIVDRVLDKRRLELAIKKHQRNLGHHIDEQEREIDRLFLAAIEALVSTLEAKDKYTAGHSRRATEIAIAIGQELNLSPDELEDLRWGALLHDIGKVALDPRIQNKPDKLTPEEYRHIMIHAQVGPGIVKPIANERIVQIIGHHHDHYDGNGLDQTVWGEDIPLGARILAVADSLVAMTSERPYRPVMSTKEALDEIKRCSSTQFDPSVVTALLKIPVAEIMLAQM